MTDKALLILVSPQLGSFGILNRGSRDTWHTSLAFLWKWQQNERLNRKIPKAIVSTRGGLHIGPSANADAHSRMCYRSVRHLTVLAGWKKGNWNVFDMSQLFSCVSIHIKKDSVSVPHWSHWVCVKCRCVFNLGAQDRKRTLDVIDWQNSSYPSLLFIVSPCSWAPLQGLASSNCFYSK